MGMMNELMMKECIVESINTWVNNKSTIFRIKKEANSGSQKTVDVKFHALKDEWKKGSINLRYCPTTENPADLLTKALSRNELRRKRELCRVYESRN